MSARDVARLGGVLLGALVFVAALAIWEAWARSAESFFLPPASDVALRAWDVWPSAGFLSAVGASLMRLSAGYAIGAVTGRFGRVGHGIRAPGEAHARPDNGVSACAPR